MEDHVPTTQTHISGDEWMNDSIPYRRIPITESIQLHYSIFSIFCQYLATTETRDTNAHTYGHYSQKVRDIQLMGEIYGKCKKVQSAVLLYHVREALLRELL